MVRRYAAAEEGKRNLRRAAKPIREELGSLVEKLAREPAKFTRAAVLMNEVEADKGGSVGEAEERVARRMREVGRAVLPS